MIRRKVSPQTNLVLCVSSTSNKETYCTLIPPTHVFSHLINIQVPNTSYAQYPDSSIFSLLQYNRIYLPCVGIIPDTEKKKADYSLLSFKKKKMYVFNKDFCNGYHILETSPNLLEIPFLKEAHISDVSPSGSF